MQSVHDSFMQVQVYEYVSVAQPQETSGQRPYICTWMVSRGSRTSQREVPKASLRCFSQRSQKCSFGPQLSCTLRVQIQPK